VPEVKPPTVQPRGPLVHVQVLPSGLEVTVYPVIAEPPLSAGLVQDTDAALEPAVAETPVGLAGTVAGTTGAEAVEGRLVPTPFVAVTVKVYCWPLVRVETVQESAPLVQAQVLEPGEEVTV
jgi:hypothetical protein